MLAVRQCQAKPRAGNITSKQHTGQLEAWSKVEKTSYRKRLNINNVGGRVWTDNEVLWSHFRLSHWDLKFRECKKMPSNASCSPCRGRADVHSSKHVKNAARKVKSSSILVMSAIYLLLLKEIMTDKQTLHQRCHQTKGQGKKAVSCRQAKSRVFWRSSL